MVMGDGEEVAAPPAATRRTLTLFALAAAALIALPLGISRALGAGQGDDYRFEIPLGAADRLAAGEAVEVLPATLDLRLDDQLVIVNRDRVAHQIGPVTVQAGQEVRQKFAALQSLTSFCSLHPGTGIEINVS